MTRGKPDALILQLPKYFLAKRFHSFNSRFKSVNNVTYYEWLINNEKVSWRIDHKGLCSIEKISRILIKISLWPRNISSWNFTTDYCLKDKSVANMPRTVWKRLIVCRGPMLVVRHCCLRAKLIFLYSHHS